MIPLPEHPSDAPAIERLLDRCFPPGRHARTVYRLREGVDPVAELSLVLRDDAGRLVGTVRQWPVLLGGIEPSLLLGPVAVEPDLQGHGLGAALVRATLVRAAALGHRSVILVGDAPYYARFGFRREHAAALALPGPVDPARFLGLELAPGSLAHAAGLVTRAVHAAAPVPADLAGADLLTA
jgi:predicted N-acetyltransferase YhbS